MTLFFPEQAFEGRLCLPVGIDYWQCGIGDFDFGLRAGEDDHRLNLDLCVRQGLIDQGLYRFGILACLLEWVA